MSGIMTNFDYSRRVAINDQAISENHFEASFYLNPDGDPALSAKFGAMRMKITGDAQKIPNKTLSEIEDFLIDAVQQMLASKVQPYSPPTV